VRAGDDVQLLMGMGMLFRLEGQMRKCSFVMFVSLALMAGASMAGCKGAAATAEAIRASGATVAEQHEGGSVTWLVKPDGTVSAVLEDSARKPLPKAVVGDVTFAPAGAAEGKVSPVAFDEKTGVLTAAGPKLDAELTDVRYALVVDGKPWNGVLHLPRGGTKELVEDAKVQAAAAGRVGPKGGVLQVVGNDRVEIVADRSSGEVRAYVLDADLKPVDPGDRRITLALDGEAPEVLVLTPEPRGHYVFARLKRKVDPTRITIVVASHGEAHTCLVGWQPGALLVVGPAAPRVRIVVVPAWEGIGPGAIVVHEHEDDDDDDGKWNIHVKGGGEHKVNVHVR
jgi:hypothetical protein